MTEKPLIGLEKEEENVATGGGVFDCIKDIIVPELELKLKFKVREVATPPPPPKTRTDGFDF